ncbi:hypothetical protein PR048_003047 [Dryococelus australis]|uniref:Transcriptional adapter 2-alpha/beta-like domain-containing protein n=1 Tax=Dryococelus australis TaxID=614101 RepID=A0ABQ9IMH5_9NEOP|nr:hypothetical protein PR048_003047 [Dryococelus australis]
MHKFGWQGIVMVGLWVTDPLTTDLSLIFLNIIFSEAKDQYIVRYLDGSIGRLTWAAAISLRPKLCDDAAPDMGPLSPAAASHLPPLDATPEEAMQLGYMPQRDDFEREYDNLAESLVSPLFINNLEDDELDIGK